ncbi:MAG: RsmB/NOP family class I SAM-dependent RNA methyltransferase [Hyphomonadaceae bacterium]
MSAGLSRRAAAELLMETLDNQRTLDEALATVEIFDRLQGPDRAFARAMASAALRQLGRIDIGLAPFLNRSLDTATPPSRALLRIGAAQAWLMETPPHAAVSETVDAAKNWPRAKQAAGFVNAVMRKVTSDRAAFDAVPALAVWPDWLQTAMLESLGTTGAEAVARAQVSEPALYLTPKDGDADALATLVEGEAVPGGSVKAPSSAIEALPGFEDGTWWVQDRAAALPAKLLQAAAGETVIDLCAAPGGKTMQLAATGAHVLAVDRSAKRLTRVNDNLARTGLGEKVDVITGNAEIWRPDTPAGKVLIDAPCSAFGTLRRHPEGAWIKRAGDVSRYPDIQKRLLRAAAEMLESGGIAIYCVCTPLKAEGLDVVEALITAGLYTREALTPADAPGFESAITAAGDILTLPQEEISHDAFFIARLKKR